MSHGIHGWLPLQSHEPGEAICFIAYLVPLRHLLWYEDTKSCPFCLPEVSEIDCTITGF